MNNLKQRKLWEVGMVLLHEKGGGSTLLFCNLKRKPIFRVNRKWGERGRTCWWWQCCFRLWWPWILNCSFQKPKGHLTVWCSKNSGHLIIWGQLSHTPGFSPPVTQKYQLQDLQRSLQSPFLSPAQKHFIFFSQSGYISLSLQTIEFFVWGVGGTRWCHGNTTHKAKEWNKCISGLNMVGKETIHIPLEKRLFVFVFVSLNIACP